MINPFTSLEETYEERQKRIKARKIAKTLEKHKQTCLGNKKKKKSKKK